MERWEGSITPTPPFSLALTAGYQTYFQGQVGADTFLNGAFSRLLVRHGRPLLISVVSLQSPEDVENPSLGIRVCGLTLTPEDVSWARERAAWILNIHTNLQPFYACARCDPALAPCLEALYGLHPPCMPSIFEGLVFAICGQQVSSLVARRIRTLLVERFGETLQWGEQVWKAFPSPERILQAGMDGLRNTGLSQRKAEYILEAARQAVDGRLPLEDMPSWPIQDVEARLALLRGVGQWTVDWVLLRALGYPDVFPAGDLALQRLLARLYNGGSPLGLEGTQALAERWRPWRGYAAVYLFAGARLGLFRLSASNPSVPV